EGMYGYSFDKPARHMREYLSILLPLLREGKTGFQGETMKGFGQLHTGDTPSTPVVLAGLGPIMLNLAGAVADGTVTWMTGPKTVADHIAPSIAKAAADAGRDAPRIVVALPTAVTDDPAAAKEKAASVFSIYGQLPSYRAMLDREGAAGPADVVIAGSEAEVKGQIEGVLEAGATEFVAVPFDDDERTLDLVASML
ncbi:MAG: LLM class flavin-dependent oxidoreductase, partial [Acidimicrobiales bacterium]